MESIQLWFRGAKIAEKRLVERPIEVGRAPSCGLVGESLALGRQFLVRSEGGTVMAYDLRGDPRRRHAQVLGREVPMEVGEEYALVRVSVAEEPETSRVVEAPLASRRFQLRVGGSHSARVVGIGPGPVTVGRGRGNTVVLSDPRVSLHHLTLTPAGAFVRICDCSSRNGTFLEGERIDAAEVGRLARLRVGSTELLIEPVVEEPSSFVARSAAMLSVLSRVDRAARLPFPVLLLGETGVGKEALARRVHSSSSRASRPFIALDLSTIPPELLASELFGFERGAFTGADRARRGAFEQAEMGTLFLDEVGELPLDLQARLLRVIETLEIRRLGSESSRRVDVRLVAATHRPLQAMVKSGAFRADLFYRLAQLPIAVPPLRERRDDILPLARAMLESLASYLGPKELSRQTEEALLVRAFEGNVRELRNLLQVAAMAAVSSTIELEDLLAAESLGTAGNAAASGACSDEAAALARFGGNVAACARALGVPRTTLRDRMRRFSE